MLDLTHKGMIFNKSSIAAGYNWIIMLDCIQQSSDSIVPNKQKPTLSAFQNFLSQMNHGRKTVFF